MDCPGPLHWSHKFAITAALSEGGGAVAIGQGVLTLKDSILSFQRCCKRERGRNPPPTHM